VPDWRVNRPSSLRHALRGHDLIEWQIPVLIASGGIQVFRLGAQIPLSKGPLTHVKQFDTVRLLDPLPKAVTAALQKAADTTSRDYAVVPGIGRTKYDDELAKLLDTRPETIRIKDTLLFDLARFVKELGTSVEATNPIRHLLPSSHANSEGQMRLKVGQIVDRAINFEDLIALVTSKAIVIDDKMLQPRPTDPKTKTAIPARFIIRGCRIGHQEKFVRKLKEALGNKTPVAAPMHYHLATPIRKPPGHIEYLGYAFELSSPTRLKDKPAIVAAMTGKAFPRIDGKAMPAKLWTDFIPKRPHTITDPKLQEGEQTLKSVARSPIDGGKTVLPRAYRYKIRKLFGQDSKVAVPGQSTREADRKKAVRDDLQKRGFFREKSGFPLWERFGLKSIDEFMNAWEWRFDPKTKAKDVTYNAFRHEYRVIEPIVELEAGKKVKKGELILNFYPTRPSRRVKAFEAMTPDDPRLYKLV
jgi:hypothetical protein